MSEFFDWQLIDFSNVKSSSGEVVVKCPICSPTRTKPENRNSKDLGVNLDNGIAHCCHCHVKSKRDSDFKMEYIPKTYKLPEWNNSTKLSNKLVKWFRDVRGISQSTLIANDIQEGEEWMPQTQKKQNCIKYPYKINEKTVDIKFRTARKHFKLSKDAKRVLLGLDDLKGFKTAYIVEGENDKLAFWEQGVKNVVSVPNGVALSEKEKLQFLKSGEFNDDNTLSLEYLDNSMEYIDHIEKWIICTDDDPAGKKLQRELIRRLGAENCEIVDLRGYNDPNDLHLADDKGLKDIKSIPVPIDGIFTIDDEWDYIQHIREYGYDIGQSIGVPEFDKHYRFRLGELDLITGIPNHGKTKYITWEMVVCSVLFGWKWAIYSPENYPVGEIYLGIIEILTNKDVSKKSSLSCSETEMLASKDFISKHFFVIDWDSEDVMVTPEMIIDKTKQLIKTKGINGLLIDPWNDLYHEYKNGENDAKYLQRIHSKFRRFKRKYNIKTVINGHPVVTKQREKEEHPEQGLRPVTVWFYDMDGGAMWGNKMDNCRTVYRNVNDDTFYTTTELHVQKVKFQKLVGITTMPESPIKLKLNGNRFFINGLDPLSKFSLLGDSIPEFDEKTGEVEEKIDYLGNFDSDIDKMDDYEQIDEAPF